MCFKIPTCQWSYLQAGGLEANNVAQIFDYGMSHMFKKPWQTTKCINCQAKYKHVTKAGNDFNVLKRDRHQTFYL